MTEERSASDRLKARLTGAVALLLIGVIGWFWLLDSDNPVEPVAQESAIPPAPDIHPFTVPQPTAPADIKPVGSERDAAVVDELPQYKEPPVLPQKVAPQKTIPQKEVPPKVVPPKEAQKAEPQKAVTQKVAPKEPVAAKPAPAPAVAKAAPAPAKPAPQPAEKFEMDTNNLPVAWVVQVGAMATQAAADKLKDDLIAKGFKAFTQPSKLANGAATIKVFVGPKLSRERADAQKKQIDAALKTSTMVVRFPAG